MVASLIAHLIEIKCELHPLGFNGYLNADFNRFPRPLAEAFTSLYAIKRFNKGYYCCIHAATSASEAAYKINPLKSS
jgi:hypothetical protein